MTDAKILRLSTTRWVSLLGVLAACIALVYSRPALERGVGYVRLGLSYNAPLDGQEGMALWEAGLLRNGPGLYQPVVPENFVSAPYPPVHPFILALLDPPPEGDLIFREGRLVSLFAVLGIALCGFGAVWRTTGSPLGGLLAAALLLSFAPLQLWAMRIKPDPLGLLFTVAGLGLVTCWKPEKSPTARALRWWSMPAPLAAAIVAFVLAHFTKQTMLAGPLAAGTFVLLHDWRLTLRCGILYVVLIALVWGTLDLVTHGQYTYHVWVLHKLAWTSERMWKFVALLGDAWPLVLVGLAGLVASLRRPTVLNAYLLWAPASLIGAGVVGSHHNHLLETGAALALAGGQAAGIGLRRGGLLRWLVPPALVLQFMAWQTPAAWYEYEFSPDPKYSRYTDFVRVTPGEVMVDDVGLQYAAGRPLRYDDPAAMGPASVLGLWDDSQFVEDIRAGKFSALLIRPNVFEKGGLNDNSGRWTRRMLQAVYDSYEIKFRDTLIIYVPKADLPAP